LTAGKYRWKIAIGKGRRRNDLRWHTERHDMGRSHHGYSEEEGGSPK
jgi:hypothetical protein